MKPSLITLTVLLLFTANLFAQHAHFLSEGVIKYERNTNMYAILRKNTNKFSDNEVAAQLAQLKSQPAKLQFRTFTSVLTFSKGKTLFAPDPGPGTNFPIGFMGYDPSMRPWTTVYTDLVAKQSTTYKMVFDEYYLIKDAAQKIKWKITEETREIAGYTCRRANGVIMDSIYVVAFYSEQIHVPGGPEVFSGLPGMILGVALPDENVTWFATSVTEKPAPPTGIVPPVKGKPLDNKGLRTVLETKIKEQGLMQKGPHVIKSTFLF